MVCATEDKSASDYITNKSSFVNTLLTKIHLSGRLEQLVDTYTSDQYKGEVVEVDTKEIK